MGECKNWTKLIDMSCVSTVRQNSDTSAIQRGHKRIMHERSFLCVVGEGGSAKADKIGTGQTGRQAGRLRLMLRLTPLEVRVD